MLRRNGPVVKSVESVLRLEGSLWGERFVEEDDPTSMHYIGMVICLEQGTNDLHMAQLMPLLPHHLLLN